MAQSLVLAPSWDRWLRRGLRGGSLPMPRPRHRAAITVVAGSPGCHRKSQAGVGSRSGTRRERPDIELRGNFRPASVLQSHYANGSVCSEIPETGPGRNQEREGSERRRRSSGRRLWFYRFLLRREGLRLPPRNDRCPEAGDCVEQTLGDYQLRVGDEGILPELAPARRSRRVAGTDSGSAGPAERTLAGAA